MKWTCVQLTKQERKWREQYAKKIVKSIFERVKDENECALLLREASDCTFSVYLEATMANFKEHGNPPPKIGGVK
jgi:hypothetical protein